MFSFIGGKLETADADLLAGLQREKDEEIGAAARVQICPAVSCFFAQFRKKDGNIILMPHLVALFAGGEITLNTAEYAEYQWVPLVALAAFAPKIDNIPQAAAAAKRLLPSLRAGDFATI